MTGNLRVSPHIDALCVWAFLLRVPRGLMKMWEIPQALSWNSLVGVIKGGEAYGGLQPFLSPHPPLCNSPPVSFDVCRAQECLCTARCLRKPLRSAVSSSEGGFKLFREPVCTAGLLQRLPAISSSKLEQNWRHSLGKISLVPTSQFKIILKVKSSEESVLILL